MALIIQNYNLIAPRSRNCRMI